MLECCIPAAGTAQPITICIFTARLKNNLIDEDLAWEIAKKYKDKDFSYTDCLSFAVMTRLGCRRAFAFDQHFRQMSFLVFP